MDLEDWPTIDRLLKQIPIREESDNFQFLLLLAWNRENREALVDLLLVMSRLTVLFSDDAVREQLSPSDIGEYEALTAACHYFDKRPHRTLNHARAARELVPDTAQSAQGYATLLESFALQNTGDGGRACDLLLDTISSAPRGSTLHARALIALCFVHWMEADILELKQVSKELLHLGAENRLIESLSFGRYFLGIAHYHLNELELAEQILSEELDSSFTTRANTYLHSAFALAFTHVALGHDNKAGDLVEKISSRLLASTETSVLPVVAAFRGELALRQGRTAEGLHLASGLTDLFFGGHRFYLPDLTTAKTLMIDGDQKSLERAMSQVEDLLDLLKLYHNRQFEIDASLLKARLLSRIGDITATQILKDALRLAQPRGQRRVFLDHGEVMRGLLVDCFSDPTVGAYASSLVDSFPGQGTYTTGRSASPLDLTTREIEILDLLANRLRNQEIADRLFISVATVKKHTSNLYGKLGVGKRREAVERAYELGILAKPS